MDSPRAAVGRARERRNLGRHRLDGLCACANHATRRIEIHVPRGRLEFAGDKPQQRRLAGAVGADDSRPSGRERERHVAESGNGIDIRKRET
jgi:hypothetical protein